jgi:poly-beta-1,6-N-acetyl-D-glucosamine N-deacetylase
MGKIIKNAFLEILYFLIRFSGISFFVTRVWTKRKVKIVVYHNPDRKVFEKHIRYLSKRYNFIYINDYIDAMLKGDFKCLPANSLCITIDDGYKENFELLDVINQYNVKPTIYLCSQIINTNRHYWDKECESRLIYDLKKTDNKKRLEILKTESGFQETKEYDKRQSLNLFEINKMKHIVDFQLHSRFHADLCMCSEEEKDQEIRQGKNDLELIIGKPCNHIAYPHGSYNQEVIEAVKVAGLKSGRTIDVGFNDRNTDPFKLRVTGISDDASINKVASQLTGITMFFLYIIRGNFKGRFTKV